MESPKKPKEIFAIKGNWDEQSKSLKEKYPTITDEDLKFEPGKEKELINRLAVRLNKKHDEVTHILKRNMAEKAKIS